MNERTIFMEALEKVTPSLRSEFLDSACAGDTALRERVEALLESHEQASGFLAKLGPERLAEQLGVKTSADRTDRGDTSEAQETDELQFLTPTNKSGSLGKLGHYDIQEVIGHGGMGIVLRAFDERLHRIVAIKVMAAHLATSAAARKRFTREAQAAAAVSHDHVVTIHAVEEANGRPYITMQYVAGMSLEERIQQRGPLELNEILRIGMQIAAGLVAAHAQGLIHRDIKPANILLENGIQRVKITDFGLARAVADASLTQTGAVAGTPHYMAPEQARGDVLDARSDLFSLGSVLYAMCTGRTPFRAAGTMAVLRRVCEEAPSPLRETNAAIPNWLASIIEKLHAKNPNDRIQTAAEVADALGRHLAHLQHPSVVEPVSNRQVRSKEAPKPALRPRRWQVAAAILLCLLGGASLSEATGVTHFASTAIRILTPNGTLVVEVDDPGVMVTIEGDGGLVITGAGPQEVRVRPGSYRLKADKDGKSVPLERELVSIGVGGREVVKVTLEAPHAAPQVQPRALSQLRRFEGHTGSVKQVAFSPDGTLALSGSGYPQGDRSVRLWNISTGQQIRAFNTISAQILTVCFSQDGQLAAGAGFGGVIRIWHTATGRQVASLESNAEVVEDLKFSPDGRHLLCATHKNTFPTGPGLAGWGKAQLWDTKTENLVWEFESEGWLTTCGFVRDGEQIVVAGRQTGNAMVLLDRETGHELQRFGLGQEADALVEELAVSNDGRLVATASESGYLCLWDPRAAGKPVQFRSNMGNLRSVAFSPDDTKLVCGSGEGETGRIELLDVTTLRVLDSVEHPSGLAWSVAFAPDGQHVLSAGGFAHNHLQGDYALRLWRLPHGLGTKGSTEVSGPQPFVIMGKNGLPRAFDSLAIAVQSASDGDTIEIRGDGPFLSEPITIQRTALTIRAGEGFRPAIRLSPEASQRDVPLLASHTALVLEGLELHRAGLEDPTNGRFAMIKCFEAPLRAANCQFSAGVYSIHSPFFVFRNCEFVAAGGVGGRTCPGARVVMENCIRHRNTYPLWIPYNDVALQDISIEIRHSTLASGSLWLQLASPLRAPEDGASTTFRLDVSDCVFDAPTVIGFDQRPEFLNKAALLSPAEAEAALLSLLQWRGERNLFATGATVKWIAEGKSVSSHGPKNLEEWKRFWRSAETGSLEGKLRFECGDLYYRSGAGLYQLTPKDFHLRSDSAGYRAGPDGKDLGADVDLVGPGAAYERWKKTPEYQDWLRETKQTVMEGAQDKRAAQIGNYVLQANEHAANGRLDQAAEAFDTAVDLIADLNPYGAERLQIVDQFVPSDELFARVVKLRPDDLHLWGYRANHFARAGRFEEAAALYQKRLDLGPGGAGLWQTYALALLAQDDETAYRSLCEKILVEFGDKSDPGEAAHAALAMALTPNAVQDKERAFRLAERAVQSDPGGLWWIPAAYAAWLYRLDRLEEALVWLDKGKKEDYQGFGLCFLAMAHHRLGHAEKAQQYADAMRQRKSAWTKATPWFDRFRVEHLIVEMDSVLAAEPDKARDLQMEAP